MSTAALASLHPLEEAAIDGLNAAFGKYSVFSGIYGIHVRRLGLVRASVGLALQWTAWPVFLSMHAQIALMDLIPAKLLGVPRADWDRYLVLDRHLIKGLGWTDQLCCFYCDYANGLCKLLSDRLEELAAAERPRHRAPALLLDVFHASGCLPALARIVFSSPIYPGISAALKMKPVSLLGAMRVQGQDQVAEDTVVGRAYLDLNTGFCRYATKVLAEIESAWCPLHHLQAGTYQDHHKYFVDGSQLELMEQVLRQWGSLKDRAEAETSARRAARRRVSTTPSG
jgi:hypothetical protein